MSSESAVADVSGSPQPDPVPRAPLVLRSTITSPYGRKVRIAVDVLGLNDRIRRIDADTMDDGDSLRQQNPLGKMPVLLLPDGTALYDSRVIIEFLQDLAGTPRLIPAEGLARYQALTRAALADGITDAALLMVYEGRFRAPDVHSKRWLDHQAGKIARGLAAFEQAPPDPLVTDVVSIGLACALGYLDWREPVAWRPRHPVLVRWFDQFAIHEPAYARTYADPAPRPRALG